jgi:hypothetical protein
MNSEVVVRMLLNAAERSKKRLGYYYIQSRIVILYLPHSRGTIGKIDRYSSSFLLIEIYNKLVDSSLYAAFKHKD